MTAPEVCEAIAGRIAALRPEQILYRDFCPAEHQRPSGWFYVTKMKPSDLNALLVRWEAEAELELFCAADAYDLPSTEALRAEQDRVLEAFTVPLFVPGGGRLPGSGRWLSVSAVGDGMEAGSAYVKFSASWTAPRQALTPGITGPDGSGSGPGSAGQIPPLMEDFEVNGATLGPGKDGA